MSNDLDILQRDNYLFLLKKIIDSIANGNKSAVFAIDGQWGIGKSFIVDKLNTELDKSKYIIFNYNCWQYDYYEEPLVAIISNIQDNIEHCKKYYDGEYKRECKIKKFVKGASDVGNNLVKKLTNIDLKQLGKSALDLNKDYDEQNSFKNIVENLQSHLKNITETIPIIFIIDELDRCMPDYAVKVLERLHHIFHGFENVIVLLSVDRTQLDFSIKKIFGESTDVDGYLKKFVDFTIKIDSGKISDDWEEKYLDSFFQSFNLRSIEDIKIEIREYLSLLDNIREVEKILNKINVVNRILKNDDRYILDDVICCYEIVYVIAKEHFKFNNSLRWLKNLILNNGCVEINNQNIKNFDKNHSGKYNLSIKQFVDLLIRKKQVSILNDGHGQYLRNNYFCIWFGLFYLVHTDTEPYKVITYPGYTILPHEEFTKYLMTISYINELIDYI